MRDEEFIRQFEDCTLESFHHADHVRLVWLYLQRDSVLTVLSKFAAGLKRFATAHGKPGLYHETITWAYVLLIHERRERLPHTHTWADFAAANPDLLVWPQHILNAYYRNETLKSDFARRVFVLPDRLSPESNQ